MATKVWDEPIGQTPRGTLILLPGRGETAATYHRFGSRMAADAYKVRLVEVDLDDLDHARTEIGRLLVDEHLPGPKVLVGSDTGAALAATFANEADAVVLAGRALPGPVRTAGREAAIEQRTACPVHRRVIADDELFEPDALSRPVPPQLASVATSTNPVLVVHGAEDVVSDPDVAIAPYVGAARARVHLVAGGRHDILNDVSHRSVAATIVLFLESLRLGPDLPPVVVPAVPPDELERSA